MRHGPGTIRRMRRCESGAAAIEFAFIGLILIMFTFGLIEFGRAYYVQSKLSHAVDLAARIILTKADTPDQVLADEIAKAFEDDPPAPTVTVTAGSTGSGPTLVSFKTIDVRVTFRPLVPELLFSGVEMRITRRVPLVP